MRKPQIIPRKQTELTAQTVASATSAELKQWLSDELGVTAHALKRAAIIWRELVERGEDLSGLRSGLTIYLGQIANDTLAPEVVVRCAGQALLLKHISAVPVSEQLTLLENGVEVVDSEEDGEKIHSVALDELTSAQTLRVFGPKGVRATQEQRKIIAKSIIKPKSKKMVEVKIQVSNEEYADLQKEAAQKRKRVATYIRECLFPTE